MRNKGLAAIAAGAVVAVVAVGTAVAAGSPNHKVVAGSSKSGTASISGKTKQGSKKHPALKFYDTRSKSTVGCSSGKVSGTIKLGKAVPASVGTVTKSSYAGCLALGAVPLKNTQVGTWRLNTAGKTVHGVTPVFVSNVKGKITSQVCNLTLAGAADGSYSNATKKLTVKPRAGSGHSLKASKVDGCSGVIKNGDTITFRGTFAVSTSKGALSIS